MMRAIERDAVSLDTAFRLVEPFGAQIESLLAYPDLRSLPPPGAPLQLRSPSAIFLQMTA